MSCIFTAARSGKPQASWADPGTVFRAQEVSRAHGCGRSTDSFMQPWVSRTFHRACPVSGLIRYFQMWILTWSSSKNILLPLGKSGSQLRFLEKKGLSPMRTPGGIHRKIALNTNGLYSGDDTMIDME